MPDYLSISKQRPSFPEYLNFQVLRDIGIRRLQALSSDLWTDYNLHDPGVTILEVLCYAITDLGYRNNFEIQDLLALNPKDADSTENNFFTPDEILSCNPVTDLDLRKRIIDIPGVRNVYFEKVGVPREGTGDIPIPYEPAIEVDLPNRELRYAAPASAPEESKQAVGVTGADPSGTLGTPSEPDTPTDTNTPLDTDTPTDTNTPLETNTPPLSLAPSDQGPSDNIAPRLHPRGLYTVRLDLDSQYRKNSCGNLSRDWSSTIDAVKRILCSTRSLCEDLYDIELLGEEEIGLCADIQLKSGADAEDVLVEIYVRLQEFLSPRLQFYTLQELVKKGKSPADIFAGRPMALSHSDRPYWTDQMGDRTYASHGFIDTEELANLTPPTQINTSDLYQVLLDVPGVEAIQKLTISNYINGLRQSEGHPWTLQLTEGYRPILGIQHSKVQLSLGDLPTPVSTDEVTRRYYEQQAAYIKAIRDPYELDLSVPKGRYYDLADYYSIHNEFPLTYGISEDGLPSTASAQRKVQAQQLKGYLVFFDQILANYLSQLSHVRDLFSWDLDSSDAKTYFSQALDFPGVEDILQGIGEDPPQSPYVLQTHSANAKGGSSSPPPLQGGVRGGEEEPASYLNAIAETPATYRDRRNRFLDHILARFAESFTDYVLLNYQLFEEERILSKEEFEQETIREKAQFFQNYPLLSHDRFRAFDYCDCDEIWNTDNVSGFQRRVASLLGISDSRRRDLNPYQVEPISGQVLSVRCYESGPSLVTTTVYPSEAEALANQETLLRLLLHPCFYARLTYNPFYHYGWKVCCMVEGEAIILRYDRYFPSRNERQQSLDPLLARLAQYYQQLAEAVSETPPETPSDVTSQSSNPAAIAPLFPQPTIVPPAADSVELPSSLISSVVDGDGLWHIQVVVPSDIFTSDIFTSDQAYRSREEAIAAGVALLEPLFTAIRQRDRYCGVVLLNDDGSEENKEKPVTIPYFGYALKNAAGDVIAEPSLIDHEGETSDEALEENIGVSINGSYRFSSEADRDLALQQWFCHLEAHQDQFEFSVVPVSGGWQFEYGSPDSDDAIRFTSVDSYATVAAAWDAATIAAASLRYGRRYVDNTQPPAQPSIGITDEDGNVLMVASKDADRNALFKQFNTLDSFLQFEEVEVREQTFPPTASIVIPFAPPEPSSDSTTETTTQYRYQLIDRRPGPSDQTTSNIASALTHTPPQPSLRPTDTLRENQGEGVPEISPLTKGGLRGVSARADTNDAESTPILIQSLDTYADEDTARDRFYQDVLSVLFEPGVICPTQNQDGFGFRLLSQPRNRVSAIAESAQVYATEAERDEAIEALLVQVRTARLAIAIQPLAQFLPVYSSTDSSAAPSTDHSSADNSSTDNSSTVSPSLPQYVGQIRANNGTILLQGQRGYLTPETAWDQGNTLMELIQDRQNFRTIEGDGVYGWELTNPEKDDVLARRYHACEQERTRTIEKLQGQVNDEGFYVVEHILLRPRSQQLALGVEAPVSPQPDSTETDSAKVTRQFSSPETHPPQSPLAKGGSPVLPLNPLGRQTEDKRELEGVDSLTLNTSDSPDNAPPDDSSGTPLTGNSPPGTHPPDNPSHAHEMDKFLPIIVNPNDAQYPMTDPDRLARQDPYSFWVTVVLPYWPKRFRNVDFRRFVERTLRLEAPAHVALRIAWVNVDQLHQFQTAYRSWLEQLGQYSCQGTACDLTRSLNQLIEILPRLRNVYPKATLHNCDQNRPGDSPILLNRTAIGNAND